MVKAKSITSFLLLNILFTSCQFSQSVKKDLVTGAYYKGNGISTDGVEIAINGKKENKNNFVFGDKVTFTFNNVEGLKKVDGKIFPKLAMYVLENERDTVLTFPNLLDVSEEGSKLSPLQLSIDLITALPIGDNYKVTVEILDSKDKGTLHYEMPFKVQRSDILQINAQGLAYDNIYLWNKNEDKTIIDNTVSQNEALLLNFEGLKGMQEIEGSVYPMLSMEITDSQGRKMFSSDNLLHKLTEEGIEPKDLEKGIIYGTIYFTQGAITNPCSIKAVLKDKNGDGSIVVTGNINVK